jgi:hypothetical protein
MSTPATPAAPAPATAAPAQSELDKIWAWIKSKVTIVEADLAKLIGSSEAAKIESAGKALLDSWLGPLAVTACQEATDVLTGKMSITKAIGNLISAAAAQGKAISDAAALQAVALAQNAVSTNADPTVTPVP